MKAKEKVKGKLKVKVEVKVSLGQPSKLYIVSLVGSNDHDRNSPDIGVKLSIT